MEELFEEYGSYILAGIICIAIIGMVMGLYIYDPDIFSFFKRLVNNNTDYDIRVYPVNEYRL